MPRIFESDKPLSSESNNRRRIAKNLKRLIQVNVVFFFFFYKILQCFSHVNIFSFYSTHICVKYYRGQILDNKKLTFWDPFTSIKWVHWAVLVLGISSSNITRRSRQVDVLGLGGWPSLPRTPKVNLKKVEGETGGLRVESLGTINSLNPPIQ